jgi:hypothetical protein
MPTDPIFEENLARSLRRANVFNPTPTFGSEVEADPLTLPRQYEADRVEPYDVDARMRALYNPEDELMKKFTESIDKMPRREDYHPSLGRRITGGLAALRDPKIGQDIVSGGFDRQLDQWKTELDPRLKAANLENTSNNNMRAIANSVISQEIADRRIEAALAKQRYSERQGDERLEQGGRRLDIAAEVAKGGQFEVDDAGNAFIVDKKGTKTRVDATYLTYAQKQALIAKSRSASRDRQKEVIYEDPDNPGQKITGVLNLDTKEITRATIATEPDKEVRPGRQTVRTLPKEGVATEELGRARRYLNNARKALSNPDWAKYIKIKGNDLKITTPGILFGPSREAYTAMSQQIFGTPTPPKEYLAEGAGTGSAAPTAGETVRVVGPNNQTGTVPKGTTLPKGWRLE